LKEPMFPALQRVRKFSSGLVVTNVLGEAPYMYGRQLLWPILRARAESGARPSPLAEVFRPWFEYLIGCASLDDGANLSDGRNRLADLVVAPEFIDCTPFNVIQNGGSMYLIDKEWLADRPAALGWIVTRGVMWSLTVGVPVANQLQPLAQVVKELCASVGLLVATEEIQQWTQEEAEFQTNVTGRQCEPLSVQLRSGGLRRIQDEIDHPGGNSMSFEEERRQLGMQLEDAQAKISGLAAETEDLTAALQRSKEEAEYTRSELENRSVEFATRLEQAWKEKAVALVGLEQAEGRAAGIDAELRMVRSRFAGVLNSRSWRVTQPMRSFREMLRRISNRQPNF
jgi:hypothetical protein